MNINETIYEKFNEKNDNAFYYIKPNKENSDEVYVVYTQYKQEEYIFKYNFVSLKLSFTNCGDYPKMISLYIDRLNDAYEFFDEFISYRTKYLDKINEIEI